MNGDTFRLPGGEANALLSAEEAGHTAHVDCFADEVVIDFPSVATAVEKMRHAFVESDRAKEHGVPLCARLHLSTRQAADGVKLPLDVPVRTTCRTCGGRGETWSEPCVRCDATGTEVLRHHVHVSLPPGVADGTRFRFTVATRNDPPTRVEVLVAVETR